jgi:hypothetical protein
MDSDDEREIVKVETVKDIGCVCIFLAVIIPVIIALWRWALR